MEGSAQAIRLRQHVLAAAAGLGRPGRVAEGLAGAPGRTGRPRPAGLVRVLHRRQLGPGPKGARSVGPTKRRKGTKWMVVVDDQGVPLGNHLDSASPAKVTLLEPTLANVKVPRKSPSRPQNKPRRIIADKGYDSDALRNRPARRGIELIAPYRSNKKHWLRYDGRRMRRYRRRWEVERTVARLRNYRRSVVRWDRDLTIYSAFFHLACLMITLKQLRNQFHRQAGGR